PNIYRKEKKQNNTFPNKKII
uniref:Uncharacterized protein n=1 Tax=Panagrolaimus sp. PS1159 TaxID=55785 RepID=A0AC35GC55_9BILA